ncbi:FAD-dependent oxidoreductase [Nocardia colli]|uniref:FAD-dependent oxidoreductase n=1 Tax=Nocardia colli TaxID=2545717 RepID=UPI0035E20729
MRTGNDWDAIVIGSGTGGLSTAAYLATNGKRVLVLEASNVIGGAAQEFRRNRVFEFTTGAHYIGDCEPDGVIPTVLRGVGLDDEITYNAMDREGFDRIVGPGVDFRVPAGWQAFEDRLIETFPADAAGLRGAVRTLREAGEAVEALGAPPIPNPWELARRPRTWRPMLKGVLTLEQLFDVHKLSPQARFVLGYICMFLLLPRTKIPTAVYAFAMHHYIKSGGWYVRGGVAKIPHALARVVRCHGGEVRLDSRVEQILIERGRAYGVRLVDGTQIHAPVVVSNADIKTTYASLIAPEHTRAVKRRRIADATLTPSLFSVYLGLDIDLREHMPAEHVFKVHSLDFDDHLDKLGIPDWSFAEQMFDEDAHAIWLTSPTVKDTPRRGSEGYSDLEITSATPQFYEFWGLEGGALDGVDYHRDPVYRERKRQIEEYFVAKAIEALPFLEGHIVWQESSSMLTHEDWTSTRHGAWAGLDFSVRNLVLRPGPATEIKGLYLAGASSRCMGAMIGTLRGGMDTAAAILGRDLWREVTKGAVFGHGLSDKGFHRAPALAPGFHAVRVAAVERDTADSVTLEFDIPEHLRETFAFTPGQHVTVRGEAAGEPVRRSYSVCTSPGSGRVCVGVKHEAGGVFSSHAVKELAPGDLLEISAPRGSFTLTPQSGAARRYAAVAAGSGITPILSIVTTILEVESGSHVTLLYGNRTRDSIMFAAELDLLTQRFPGRLQLVYCLSRDTSDFRLGTATITPGRVGILTLAAYVADPTGIDGWFLCGPTALIDTVTDHLTEVRGIPEERIHSETFTSATSSVVRSGKPGPPSTVRLTYTGNTTVLDLPRNGDTILDAALERNIDLPYSCLTGSCGTCRAKIEHGEVEFEDEPQSALTTAEAGSGYTLSCLARPLSDEVTLNFDA